MGIPYETGALPSFNETKCYFVVGFAIALHRYNNNNNNINNNSITIVN